MKEENNNSNSNSNSNSENGSNALSDNSMVESYGDSSAYETIQRFSLKKYEMYNSQNLKY